MTWKNINETQLLKDSKQSLATLKQKLNATNHNNQLLSVGEYLTLIGENIKILEEKYFQAMKSENFKDLEEVYENLIELNRDLKQQLEEIKQ
jgi:precorrin-6B methylase 1